MLNRWHRVKISELRHCQGLGGVLRHWLSVNGFQPPLS